MKILIAEDDPVSRTTLQKALERWDHDVLVARDGSEALELLDQHANAIRLAVLDWMMPGMEGVDLCRHIRQAHLPSYVYVILLTSRSDKADLAVGLQAGADDYVTKPFDLNELRSRIAIGMRIAEYEDRLAEGGSGGARLEVDAEPPVQEPADQPAHSQQTAAAEVLAASILREIDEIARLFADNHHTLQRGWAHVEPLVHGAIAQKPPDQADLERAIDVIPEALARISAGLERISTVLDSLEAFCRPDPELRRWPEIKHCVETTPASPS